jgi:hypothetical protein
MLLAESEMEERVPEHFTQFPARVLRVHYVLLMNLTLLDAVACGNVHGQGIGGHVGTSESVVVMMMLRSRRCSIMGSAGTQYSGDMTPRAARAPDASISAMIEVG